MQHPSNSISIPMTVVLVLVSAVAVFVDVVDDVVVVVSGISTV